MLRRIWLHFGRYASFLKFTNEMMSVLLNKLSACNEVESRMGHICYRYWAAKGMQTFSLHSPI